MYYFVYHLFGNQDDRMKSELFHSLQSLNRVISPYHKSQFSVVIYTDDPFELPDSCQSVSTEFQRLDQESIRKEIENANGCLYVIKTFVMSRFFRDFRTFGIFLDTDTFFMKDPFPLFASLANGFFLMHLKEYPILVKKDICSFLKRSCFQNENLGNYRIYPDFHMWNAGVIGIGPDQEGALPEIVYLIKRLASNDDLLPEDKRLCEQTAFSYCLERYPGKLLPAEDYIFHYWFFKESRLLLAGVFNNFYCDDRDEFDTILKANGINQKDYANMSYEQIPSLIFKLMRKYGKIDSYHYVSLPTTSRTGKTLRSA